MELRMQLRNELGENMTTCGSLAAMVGVERCTSLQAMAQCTVRKDCTWTVLPPDSGACSPKDESELVEIFVMPSKAGSDEGGAAGLGKFSGVVKACDHGQYLLAYSLKEQGRFELHVRVGGKEVSRSPFRIMVAPGCRSGAVEWPCSGRGVCKESGRCVCAAGYLGSSCQLECPGMDDDGMFCSGRGNCTLKPGVDQKTLSMGKVPGECECEYGFIGRLCHLECPGGSGNVCSGNGLCLEDGQCQCLAGYGGERCQFKNREVEKFGSMSALFIIMGMLAATIILVFCVVLKDPQTRILRYNLHGRRRGS
mmetsp:Transcript_34367/g.67157  ORF Transcript_34367/g.67157 Transcript_34367/m.67157 type:complete len:309 (+) Transcript_34367:2-928(+)